MLHQINNVSYQTIVSSVLAVAHAITYS